MKACAFSPGKAILLGEHFVVHGAYALVAAIQQGSFASTSFSDTDEIVSESLNIVWKEGLTVPTPLLPYKKALDKIRAQYDFSKKIKTIISTNLPISAGLGSSSSTSVAFSASVLKLVSGEVDYNMLFNISMESERITHGNPSGVDVFIGIRGGVHLFKKDGFSKEITLPNKIKVLLINTGAVRQTSKLISKFSHFKDLYPSYFKRLVESSSHLTLIGSECLSKGSLEEFGLLMCYQHAILSYFGVSNEMLDKIVELAMASGALGAKLTGAGGGGCAIVLPKQSMVEETLNNFKNFEVYISEIPAGGLKVWIE
ncbi:MAG: mevalonate kinase [Candidatus Bathyarchaeia archaeon]